jgi:hypothetical protein
MAFAIARRAWNDYQKTKASVPVLRKAAWLLIRTASGWIVGLAALVVAAVAFAATDAKLPSSHPCPASSAAASPAVGGVGAPSPSTTCR